MIVASPRGKTKGPASRVPPGGGPKLSLTERVYAALKKDIITGELMPGQAFTENDLAHCYTASRTPVREAAVRLQAEELVRIVANRGYFVTQLTIPPQALSELERTACFRADDGKFAAFIAADTAFHLGIARLTHTPCWQERHRKCAHKLSALCSRPADSIDVRFYGELPARQHMAILRAILRKDPRTRPPAHARAHHRGPEEIAILPYASAGICSIASACDFSERPKVVLGEFEFPTMGHAWLAQ